MDPSLRNRSDLISRLDKMQSELIRRFQNLVDLAAADTKEKKDRSVTAVVEYQIKVETAALVRQAEDVQSLIRQVQELWLFGELDTVGESRVKGETDARAREVAGLLGKLGEGKIGVGGVEGE